MQAVIAATIGAAAVLGVSVIKDNEFKAIKEKAYAADNLLQKYEGDAHVIAQLLGPSVKNMESIKLHVDHINLIRSVDMTDAILRTTEAAKDVLDREKTIKTLSEKTLGSDPQKSFFRFIVLPAISVGSVAVSLNYRHRLINAELNGNPVPANEDVVINVEGGQLEVPGMPEPEVPEPTCLDALFEYSPSRATRFAGVVIVVSAIMAYGAWKIGDENVEKAQRFYNEVDDHLNKAIIAINDWATMYKSFFGEIENYYLSMQSFINAVVAEARLLLESYGATAEEKKIVEDLATQIKYPTFSAELSQMIRQLQADIAIVTSDPEARDTTFEARKRHAEKLDALRTKVAGNTKLKEAVTKLYQDISDAVKNVLPITTKISNFLGEVAGKLTAINMISQLAISGKDWKLFRMVLKREIPEYTTKSEADVDSIITAILGLCTDHETYSKDGTTINLKNWRENHTIPVDRHTRFEYVRQVDATLKVQEMEEKKSAVWEYIYQFASNSGPNSDSNYNYAFLFARNKRKELGGGGVARRLNSFEVLALRNLGSKSIDWGYASHLVESLFPGKKKVSDELIYATITLFTNKDLSKKDDKWPLPAALREQYKKTETSKYADQWMMQAAKYISKVQESQHSASIFNRVYLFLYDLGNEDAFYWIDNSELSPNHQTSYKSLDEGAIARIKQIYDAITVKPAKSYVEIKAIIQEGIAVGSPTDDIVDKFAALFTDEETFQGKNLVEIRARFNQEVHSVIDEWLIQAKLKSASDRDSEVPSLKRKLLDVSPSIGSAMMTFETKDKKILLMAYGKDKDIYLGATHDNRVWKHYKVVAGADPHQVFGMCQFKNKVVIAYSTNKQSNDNGYQLCYAYSGDPELASSWTDRTIKNYNGNIGIGVSTWTLEKPKTPFLATRLVISYINKNGGICTAISFNDPTVTNEDIFNDYTPVDAQTNAGISGTSGIGMVQHGKRLYMAYIKDKRFHLAVSNDPFPLEESNKGKWRVTDTTVDCAAGIGLAVYNFKVRIGLIDTENKVKIGWVPTGAVSWKFSTTKWEAKSGFGLTTFDGELLSGAFVDKEDKFYVFKQDVLY